MAVIKINRSQSQVRLPQQNNLTGLVTSPNLAIMQGNAINSISKAIEDASAKTKKTLCPKFSFLARRPLATHRSMTNSPRRPKNPVRKSDQYFF